MLDLFTWLFKGSEGVVTSDKILLFFVKLVYLSLRILLRLALGKKRRDKLYIEKALNFRVFGMYFLDSLEAEAITARPCEIQNVKIQF